MKRSPTPDEVCASYPDSGAKITIRMLDDDYILIEGTAEALEFVGKLFQAQAATSKDCGFQISPTGAGSAFFSESSALGIYIHRLPCLETGPPGSGQ